VYNDCGSYSCSCHTETQQPEWLLLRLGVRSDWPRPYVVHDTLIVMITLSQCDWVLLFWVL
jgi:hypothetical protein